MSYTLDPIVLTKNVTSYVTLPGSGQSVSYIKLTNASPYLVLLSNLVSGQDYLEPGECNVWQVDGLSTAIQAMPQQFVTTPPTTIPVSVLVATWFLAGEPSPSGNYPVNFNLLNYTGNASVANQIINDGNPVGTEIVESTNANTTGTSNIAIFNDGTVKIYGVQSLVTGSQATLFSITPGVHNVSDAAISFMNNLISIDRFGDITVDGSLLVVGSLTAYAPVQLQTSNQETGACGGGFTATAAGQIFMYVVNFKTVMTNIPSSITLTVGSSANMANLKADVISRYGFRFWFTSVAAGTSEWIGTYTTVGN